MVNHLMGLAHDGEFDRRGLIERTNRFANGLHAAGLGRDARIVDRDQQVARKRDVGADRDPMFVISAMTGLWIAWKTRRSSDERSIPSNRPRTTRGPDYL